jgi:hypothetical protein
VNNPSELAQVLVLVISVEVGMTGYKLSKSNNVKLIVELATITELELYKTALAYHKPGIRVLLLAIIAVELAHKKR